MTKYFIELLQDPREAKAESLAALKGNLAGTTKMQVPKEEFYNAARHFHSNKVAELFLSQEGKYPNLMMSILGVTLGAYMEAMFKGGRWKESENGSNLHIFGGENEKGN